MKLIIDISKEMYNNINKIQNGSIGAKQVLNAIKNGTPIPDNATNEDIINTMFDMDMAYNIRCYVKNYMLMGEWLDASYQKGGE